MPGGDNTFRHKAIVSLIIIGCLVLIGNLFEHQVINKTYSVQAQNRTLIKRTIAAPRGIIYDRNEHLLVVNEPTYELEMIYREIEEDMDLNAFCQLLEISIEEYENLMTLARSRSYFRTYIPITFLTNIEPSTFARLQEHLFQFPGFYPKLKCK